jgi:hypothetical protein
MRARVPHYDVRSRTSYPSHPRPPSFIHSLLALVKHLFKQPIKPFWPLPMDSVPGALPLLVSGLGHLRREILAVAWIDKVIVIACDNHDVGDCLCYLLKTSGRDMVCSPSHHLREVTHKRLGTGHSDASTVYLIFESAWHFLNVRSYW